MLFCKGLSCVSNMDLHLLHTYTGGSHEPCQNLDAVSHFWCPSLIFLDYSLLVESPRWLYAVGRTSEANAVVKKIAKINRRQLPQNLNVSVVVSQRFKFSLTDY